MFLHSAHPTVVWKDADNVERSATIHWGTYNDEVFEELESPTTLDTTASSVKLDVIIDGYYFVGAVYKATESAEGVNLSSTTLKKAADGTWQVTLEGSGATTIADGSHIYVNYASKSDGQYVPPSPPTAGVLAPETDKTVTDNGDGTFTIQLDIEGKEDETITQIGANVVVVMDITQSMTNTMPNSTRTRMAAAKSALNTLITTLDPDVNLINFTAVNFAISRNGATLARDWTTQKSQMTAYVDGLPNNPTEMGTNWKAGLQGGIGRVNNAAGSSTLNKNETYVIFVTDGNPNCYMGNNNDWHPSTGPGFNQQAYNAAVTYANQLGGSSHFYGVFVGDDDGYDHLDELISNANGVGTIRGTNEEDLKEEFGKIAQTIIDNLGAGSVVVDDGIPTLSNVSANVSAGEAGGFEYYITPKNGTQSEWTDAPGASYSNSNGVTWNLSEAGTLKDGWIYTLKFTVWPSQAAYDLIADLNNGKINYSDLTEEQKASVQGSKETGYTLKTNTHLYTTFKDLDGNEYMEENDASAKAMPLPTETISVEKLWHNYLDSRSDGDIDGLQLVLSRDGKEYLEFDVSSDTNWKKEGIYISCGQIAGGVIKETGHDYYVTEKPKQENDKTEYWEVNSPVYHPMVVDGTMELFVEDDEASNPVFTLDYEDKDGNVTTHKYVRPTGTTTTNLTAINERVSWLNLTKIVSAESGITPPADALFEYKVTITEPTEGSEVYFSVRGGGVNYRDDIETSATKWVDESTGNTYYRIPSGTEFTLKIKAGWNARFLNLETGSTYSIEEQEDTMDEGFIFETAQNVETFYSALNTPAEGYPITTTEDNPTENGAVVEGSTVSGTINQTNTDYSATYTNKYLGVFYVYHSSDNTVERYPMAVNGVQVTDFNIFELTKSDTLYGGYYSDYAGKSSVFDAAALDYNDGNPKDEGGTAYSYTYIKNSNRGAWSYADGYDVSGKAMDPETNAVYYIKEVPTAYVLPYTHYTYNKSDKLIRNMWYISAIDDLCYQEAGFFVETVNADGKKTAEEVVDTLTVTNNTGGATVTLSPKSLFGNKGGSGNGVQAGYLTYWDARAKIAEGASSVFTPYWLTKDGIYTCGVSTRTINFNNKKVGSGGMRIADAANATIYPTIE